MHHSTPPHTCKYTMYLKPSPLPLEDMFFLLWKKIYFLFQIQYFPTWFLIFWVNYCNLHYPSLKLTGLIFQKDVKFLTSVHEDFRMKDMNPEILHQYRHRCPPSILPFIYTWLDILKVYGYLYLPIHVWFKQKLQFFITSTCVCTHV